MQKYLFIAALLLCSLFSYSQEWNSVFSTAKVPADAKVTLISSDLQTSVFQVNVAGYYSSKITIANDDYTVLSLGGTTPMLRKGAPGIPKVAVSLIIPDKNSTDYTIISSKYVDVKNVKLAPSKGSLSRAIDPATVPYVFGPEYDQNAFYPEKMVSLQEPYILRDVRGQSAWIFPFRYNPVTRTLRVFYEIIVEVSSTKEKGNNTLAPHTKPTALSAPFKSIYQTQFLNGTQVKYTAVEEQGNMLIISCPDFISALLPLADWRNKTGHPTEIVSVSTIGGSAEIKAFIANYYTTQGLTYVLLAGDAVQVPPGYSNGDSDNEYTYINGNDHYPELFIGRFSAENLDQVITQVTRTLEYEQTPYNVIDWHSHNIGIASSQGTGDDNEYDYEHIRNIQIILEDYTYTVSEELFDGSQGGDDAPGNPTPAMVAADIETGASLINYVGHGSTTSWSTSGFNNSDVNNLTNTGMLPYIISVACVNGNFVGSTCFAEAWLRATHNNAPSGAVAIIASTINQDWDEPMEGQDAMNDILAEVYPANIKRTFGGITFNGMMQMMDSYGNSAFDMADTWTIFGDPALMIRTTQPVAMTVSHEEAIYFGLNSFTVQCNKNGALATLVQDGVIIDTQVVAENEVTFSFSPFTELGEVDLTITAFNTIPYMTVVPIMGGAPGMPCNPSPGDNAPGISLLTAFDWEMEVGGPEEGFLFYLGTDNPPSNICYGIEITESGFPGMSLNPETVYYWQVKAFNDFGIVEGPIWSFTTKHAPDDDFESGDFSAQNWMFSGDANWIIDNSSSLHGNYSARSGAIDDNQSSTLRIEMESVSFGTLSFWVKPSCEMENDYLTFMVNGQQKMIWTGQPENWVEYTYFVGPGPFIFEWIYSKDGNGNIAGEDCARIDFVYFPLMAATSCIAGEDQVICSNDILQLDAVAYNYNDVIWTTSGDGVFSDATVLNPVYIPGENDIQDGTALLTLTAMGITGNVSDDMEVSFIPAPEVFAGNFSVLCANAVLMLDSAQAEHYTSLIWSTSGDGVFSDPAVTHPEYYPGPEDIASESIILTLTASGNTPCTEVSDELLISIIPLPETPEIPQGPEVVDLFYISESVYSIEPLTNISAYEWVAEPEYAVVLQPVEDGSSVIAQWNNDYEGEVILTVRGHNSCGEGEYSEGLEIVIGNTVGIFAQNNKLSMYPNPTEGYIYVTFPSGVFSRIIVFSLTGDRLLEKSIGAEAIQENIDLRQLCSGVYFITLNGDNHKVTKRLLIK
ncbi:MAG TPA: C25 family cysteine peptidase [Bacteroidales bacterium]|nr:C25 family cysteine peptidase [Bacteroidales bacterium]